MQWIIGLIPLWLMFQLAFIVGHAGFSAWNGAYKFRECAPGVNYVICGTPLESIASQVKEVPELDTGKQEQSLFAQITPDWISGLASGAGSLFEGLKRAGIIIGSIVFFNYDLVYDDSFLGIAAVILQVVTFLVGLGLLVGLATAAVGIFRG